jgi:hypothetical protein
MDVFKPRSSLHSNSKYIALFDYEKKSADELNMVKNDQILVMLAMYEKYSLTSLKYINYFNFIKEILNCILPKIQELIKQDLLKQN